MRRSLPRAPPRGTPARGRPPHCLFPPSRPEEAKGRRRSTGIRSGRRATSRSPGSSVFPWCPHSEKLDPTRQVDAPLVKGMAPADPPDPVQHSEDRPVQADRSDHVLGATGVEPAAVADGRGYRRLVQPQEADEELSGPHGEPPLPPQRRRSAGSSSAHTEERTAPAGDFRTTIAVRVPRGK